MRRKLLLWGGIAAIALAALTGAALIQPAGSSVSSGCAWANNTPWDTYATPPPTELEWWKGDVLTISTSEGAAWITLFVGDYPQTTTTGPGSIVVEFPSSGLYNLSWGASNIITWDVSCQPSPNPVPEPYFESVHPANDINADALRAYPYLAVYPVDVFYVGWWGVKTIEPLTMPLTTGLDLTTYEVRCMNGNGEWTAVSVAPYFSSIEKLQVEVNQHGYCGLFAPQPAPEDGAEPQG